MAVKMQELAADRVDDLLRFSRTVFGERSYQGTRRYIDWLYGANPFAQGLGDCLVAVEDEAVVGCIHRMRLPLAGAAGADGLTSLQNHIVSPKVKSGVGLMLLRRCAKEAAIAFSPGVNGRLAQAYRQLRHPEVPTHWLWKPVRPIKAAAQLGLARIFPARREGAAVLAPARVRKTDFAVTTRPGEPELAAMAAAMTGRFAETGNPHVAWTPELVGWRYFSNGGPASLLVGTPGQCPWAVLSYGVRNGLPVARLMEYEEKGDPRLMRTVVRAARDLGAAALLGYTTEESIKDRLLAAGWRLKKDPPFSFVLGASALSVGAAAADLGFEALTTTVAT
jgi:predicted N-acetyltransferase YhbS